MHQLKSFINRKIIFIDIGEINEKKYKDMKRLNKCEFGFLFKPIDHETKYM